MILNDTTNVSGSDYVNASTIVSKILLNLDDRWIIVRVIIIIQAFVNFLVWEFLIMKMDSDIF